MMSNKHNLLVVGLFSLGMVSAGAALARDTVDESKSASADGVVRINVVRGELTIEGWDKDEISVSGKLDEQYEEFVFEVNDDDAVIRVKIPSGRNSWCCDEGSDLTIKLPQKSKVHIGGVSTDIEAENILGGLDVSGVSGNIRVEKIRERIHLTTVSGEVDVRDVKGRVRVRSVSGDIEAYDVHGVQRYHSVSGNVLVKDVSDDLDLESVSGDLELVAGVLNSVRGHSVSGDIDLQSELLSGASIEFDSISGTVRLRLSGDLDAKFDLQTGSGSIRNRITSDRPKESKYVRDETLRFIVGDGEGEVTISTRSGDIILSSQ